MPDVPRSAAALASVAAVAARRVDGVVRLSAGRVGEVATHGPGQRVDGVRMRPGEPARLDVHVVVGYPAEPLIGIAERVRSQVQASLDSVGVRDVVVDVRIADIDPSASPAAGGGR